MIDTITVEETRLSYLLSNVMEQPGDILTTVPDPFDEAYQIAVMINRDGKVLSFGHQYCCNTIFFSFLSAWGYAIAPK